MTIFLLARHGETDWNAAGRWQGHADVALNARGRAQAEALARRLDGTPIAAAYASDLSRARQTAEAVAGRRGLPVTVLAELREVDVGEWSGLTTVEVAERWPERAAERAAGGLGWREGESYEAMAARVLACLDQLARRHDGEQVLCVSHGGTIRCILAHAHGIALAEYRRRHSALPNASLHRVAVAGGRLTPLDAHPAQR